MPPTNRRTHPEGHEKDVLLRLGVRLGRLGLQDLARPAVRSEQGHKGIDVGNVDGDRDDKRRPEPGERGAAAASPAVELVDVDKVELRAINCQLTAPSTGPYRRAHLVIRHDFAFPFRRRRTAHLAGSVPNWREGVPLALTRVFGLQMNLCLVSRPPEPVVA